MKINVRFSFAGPIAQGRIFRQLCAQPLILSFFFVLSVATAWGAIPPGERTVLQNLYTSTNGSGWTQRTNWNGTAGTECTWYGVYCDGGGNHVLLIYLGFNNLVGTLPSLSGLANLQDLSVSYNHLSGSIPSLAGLANLQTIDVSSNQLTGSLPSLTGLANLQYFDAGYNQLSGSLPALGGLTNLQTFSVYSNQLTGSLPALSGHANLRYFNVGFNYLTGAIPSLSGLAGLHELYLNANQLSGSLPPLSDLTALQFFALNNNQLTGPIPSLSALSNLLVFDASYNQLTGSIPSLAALTSLQDFRVFNNQLTGSLPQLSGLANLNYFYANNNQFTGMIPSLSGLASLRALTLHSNRLTGSIPPLTGLSSLEWFSLSSNYLTGSIPSLTGLANLHILTVDNNYLSGNAPAVPSPNNLTSGQSHLCPNYLNATTSAAWDAATATAPWYQQCTAGPAIFSVNYDGNGSTSGSVPDTGTIYTTGQTVTVLGNTGALDKTGFSFNGWNSAPNGSGMSYAGGNTFQMGSANVILYALWAAAQVRIYDTGIGYADIQDAYNHAADGDTIEARTGLQGQQLVFNKSISIKLTGGYDDTFTSNSGSTVVGENMQINGGSVEIANIVIQ